MNSTQHQSQKVSTVLTRPRVSLRTMSSDIGGGGNQPSAEVLMLPETEHLKTEGGSKEGGSKTKSVLMLILLIALGVVFYYFVYPQLRVALGA